MINVFDIFTSYSHKIIYVDDQIIQTILLGDYVSSDRCMECFNRRQGNMHTPQTMESDNWLKTWLQKKSEKKLRKLIVEN